MQKIVSSKINDKCAKCTIYKSYFSTLAHGLLTILRQSGRIERQNSYQFCNAVDSAGEFAWMSRFQDNQAASASPKA